LMDTAALKASWGKVVAAGDGVPLYFYSHLFLRHPELRSMFPIQMTAQRDKLWPPWALSRRTSTRSTTWCLCSSNWVVTTVASR
jgi:Globin